jgi:beta-galactosidase
VIDHDDVPRRRFEEVRQIGAELSKIGEKILGTHVHVEAAVAAGDFDVAESHTTYPLGLPSPGEIARKVHRTLFQNRLAAGCIHPADDLSDVRLYIIPHFALFDPEWLTNLLTFVERGGVLVVGARSGTRDLDNNIVAAAPPGCLAAPCGITVEEYGRQNRPDQRPLAFDLGGKSVTTELWYEVLECRDGARPLATWDSRHLRGKCAISERAVGAGTIIYVGTYLSDGVLDVLAPLLIERAGLAPAWPGLPDGVNVVVRRSERRQLYFFLNSRSEARTIGRWPAGQHLLPVPAPGELGPYGVALIETERT